jgi:hypothetical protein
MRARRTYLLGGITAAAIAVTVVLAVGGDDDHHASTRPVSRPRPKPVVRRPKLVVVSPAVGDPTTTFVVKVRAIIPLENGWENYHFIMSGSGRKKCGGPRFSSLGFEEPEHGYYVARYLPRREPLNPVAPRADWCPGLRYRGLVELRNPSDLTKTKVLGRFEFTVRAIDASRER